MSCSGLTGEVPGDVAAFIRTISYQSRLHLDTPHQRTFRLAFAISYSYSATIGKIRNTGRNGVSALYILLFLCTVLVEIRAHLMGAGILKAWQYLPTL